MGGSIVPHDPHCARLVIRYLHFSFFALVFFALRFFDLFFQPRNFDLIEFLRAPEFSRGIKAASGIFSISEIGAVAGARATGRADHLAL